MLFGVLLMVVSYMLVFRPQMERASETAVQNEGLDSRLNELLSMAEKKDYYQRETQNMQEEIDTYCEKFPADIKEETELFLPRILKRRRESRLIRSEPVCG